MYSKHKHTPLHLPRLSIFTVAYIYVCLNLFYWRQSIYHLKNSKLRYKAPVVINFTLHKGYKNCRVTTSLIVFFIPLSTCLTFRHPLCPLSDMLFLQGSEVIFKVALSLLGSHKPLILQHESLESIVDFIKTTLPNLGLVQMEKTINQVRNSQ